MAKTTYIVAGLVTALVGYGIYFDYKRRTSPEFRKKLAKQRQEAAKILEAQKNDSFTFASPSSVGAFDIPDEPIPTTNEGREKYFMNHLQLGEQLMLQGPAAYDAAATCFYRALQVYPEPQKLLEVLSQSIPEVIINKIIQKMAAEVKAAQEAHPRVEEIE